MAAKAHIIQTETDSLFTAWCGHTQRSNFRMSKNPRMSDICPKCSAKYYAAQIGANFPYSLGERIPQERFADLKSVYPIIQRSDQSVRGFVVIRNGWGKSWSVRALQSSITMAQARVGTVPEPTMERDDVRYSYKISDKDEAGYTRPASGNSKEEILSFVPTLIEQGKLPSSSELAATALGHIEEMRSRLATQEARRTKQSEETQLISEEFATLLAGTSLTNRQRTAIFLAAKRLDIEVPQ